MTSEVDIRPNQRRWLSEKFHIKWLFSGKQHNVGSYLSLHRWQSTTLTFGLTIQWNQWWYYNHTTNSNNQENQIKQEESVGNLTYKCNIQKFYVKCCLTSKISPASVSLLHKHHKFPTVEQKQQSVSIMITTKCNFSFSAGSLRKQTEGKGTNIHEVRRGL